MDRESVYIRQIIDGDVARFSWFVETYKDMAFSIACRILGNDQDAEEVVQDAFLQAFRSIRSFKGQSTFSTWLYRIVVNGSLNRLKKKKLERSYEDVELAQESIADVESCYRQLTMQDQAKFINQALERLRAEDRLILTLQALAEAAAKPLIAEKLDAYIAPMGVEQNAAALALARELRAGGLSIEVGDGTFRLKKSFELADKLARHIVILGEDEISSGAMTVKTFASGEQIKIERGALVEALRS